MAGTVPCDNCGSYVSKQYARVMSPQVDPESVEACPYCPDLVWDGNGTREAKAVRHQGH